MKRRLYILSSTILFCLFSIICLNVSVCAKTSSEQKKEYTNALSEAIRDGVEQKNMDLYAKLYKTTAGKNALRQAAIQNRAALMAEGIDFLDDSWKDYYAIEESEDHIVFNTTKIYSRKTYKKRYQKIMNGLNEVLSCVESTMTDADKAMAVYYFIAKHTTYQASADCHTGYDVLVNHTGVCDGFANAYALAMNTLGIPCAVVSNYTKDHSWNIVQIDGTWYFCDLTNGIGTGNHEGMVVSYSSCLVGAETFLESHPGYTMQDVYGQANSNDLNTRSISLAVNDYIPNRSDIRVGISSKSCMFYHNGYWYWISTGNMLKKSRLNGSDMKTVFVPKDDEHIGWAEEFNDKIFISINDGIYQMSYNGKLKGKVRQVAANEYQHGVSSYFWQIAYVGRFFKNTDGTLGYYVTDLHGEKKGLGKIETVSKGKLYGNPKLPYKKITLRAGYSKQLFVMNTTVEGARIIKWKSSNTAVAQVDKNGWVTGKKKGTTVITAIVGTKKISCTVRVNGYTITYKKAGINSPENKATASGKKKITLKEPKKNEYEFVGWYLDKARKKVIKIIKKGNSKNYILYAKWEKEEE